MLAPNDPALFSCSILLCMRILNSPPRFILHAVSQAASFGYPTRVTDSLPTSHNILLLLSALDHLRISRWPCTAVLSHAECGTFNRLEHTIPGKHFSLTQASPTAWPEQQLEAFRSS